MLFFHLGVLLIILCFYCFLTFTYLYWEGKIVEERGREKEREKWSSIYWFTPQMAALAEAELPWSGRNREPLLGLSHECRVSRPWTILLLSQATSRDLEETWSSHGTNLSPYGSLCFAGGELVDWSIVAFQIILRSCLLHNERKFMKRTAFNFFYGMQF